MMSYGLLQTWIIWYEALWPLTDVDNRGMESYGLIQSWITRYEVLWTLTDLDNQL